MIFFCASLQSDNYSYSDLLKVCSSGQVKALKEVNAYLRFDADIVFQSLEGGLTAAKVYSFEIQDKKFVLRFLDIKHSKRKRENEIYALKIGDQLKISPSYVFSDKNAFLTVMSFIEGHALHQPSESQLKNLGKMLKKLHNYSDFYPIKDSLIERLKRYYQKGIKSKIAYPTGFDQEIRATLNKPCLHSLAPSHGDLNPYNILINDFNGKINIIDWTTATLDDPFADLSYFCLLSNLTVTQEKIFLTSYLGRAASKKELQTLKENKGIVCLLKAALWFQFSETDKERMLPHATRISSLDTKLYSSTLKSFQDYLAEQDVVNFYTAPKSEVKSYALSFYKAYLESKTMD